MVERMHWHESFSVGVGIIDEQHRQLFVLINELIDAVAGGQRSEGVARTLPAVLDYAALHFSTEEQLFKIHPQFAAHCAAHEQFTAQLLSLNRDLTSGKSAVSAGRLLELLSTWLQNHILKTDIAYASDLGFRPRQTSADIEQQLHLLTHQDKVLVVDDSPVQRLLLKKNLEKSGFEVLEAASGIEALALIDHSFDLHLVITDLHMPEMDGFEVIKAIRERHLPSVYIIVVTMAAEQEALIRSFQLGANDFLIKPIVPQELEMRLRNGINLLRLESQDELIFSMAKLADCRSPETGRHLERVQNFTRLLGRQLIEQCPELGLTESVVADIARVSPLHDIGKVGIADGILNKPGRLTPEEFTLMKEHARIGGDLISEILRKRPSRSLRLAFEVTMYHHERWDGTGYPLGLSGDDIPVAARIMALADVYDALTSHRVYKKAYAGEQAREIIEAEAGSHFDPRLVAAFLKVEDRFHQLRLTLED